MFELPSASYTTLNVTFGTYEHRTQADVRKAVADLHDTSISIRRLTADNADPIFCGQASAYTGCRRDEYIYCDLVLILSFVIESHQTMYDMVLT